MSKMCWQNSLQTIIQKLPQSEPRLAVVGVGHELRGDDAAGVMVARYLQERIGPRDRWLVIDGGHAPENCTAPLRRFKPDLVILVDAAALNLSPGAIQLLSWQQIGGLSATTHTLPLHLLARYLIAELNCEVILIAIQPQDTSLGVPLSPLVQSAVDEVGKEIERLESRDWVHLIGSDATQSPDYFS